MHITMDVLKNILSKTLAKIRWFKSSKAAMAGNEEEEEEVEEQLLLSAL